MSPLPANELDDIVKEFLVESRENLDRLDQDLVRLEREPLDCDTLASVFRTIHTIKGTCGFFGFARLEAVTHAGENLLSRLRDGQLLLDAAITSALLALVDAVRALLAAIEATGQEGEGDYAALVGTLTRLQEGQPADYPVPAGDTAGPPEPPAEPEAVASGAPEGSIRVDVGLLDKLMNLVGELVLARNQLLQLTAVQKDAAFQATSQRLNLITSELQEGVLKTRMQPIGNIWNKLPRVVRDLSLACAKQVRLVVEGNETELDKTLLEAIKDPLTHLVRNAVDHGIEPPDTRRARGKPAEGCLSLRAFHEGGQVNIEIADDGSGIDPERVRRKVVERGLIPAEQAARLGERELTHLIFLPGFSIADRVTHVSGRGVGMDVVKTNIEKIGGTVDVHSRLGHGTRVKVKVPLTLAIIPALIVTSGGDRYALAQVNLLELVRLEGEQARRRIEHVYNAPVYRLRGRLLPLVDLNHELGVECGPASRGRDTVHIVVLQAGERQFGLVVDGIQDTEEIVVKPLGKLLQGLSLFAGATILGDGRVALILDVLGLAQKAGVVTVAQERTAVERGAQPAVHRDVRQTLLLLGLGREQRLAIPLPQVTRLEEFPRTAVERTSRHEVVQYRGQILPLIRLGAMLADPLAPPASEPERLQVVVYSAAGRSVGLVVDHILDTVEADVSLQPTARRPGVLGSAVLRERVTDLLDVPGLIRAADPGFFEQV